MRKLLLGILGAAALAAQADASIILSSSVPQDQKQVIVSDLVSLAKSPFVQDAKLASLMGIPTTDGLSLVNWVDNRLNYVVSQDYALDKNLVQPKSNYQFENTPLPDIPHFDSSSMPKSVKTVMTNIGGAVYIMGKQNQTLLALKVDNQVVEFRSPRTGLFQVGEGMFSAAKQLGMTGPEISKAFRLATLIHESRHSDGRGETTGFLHTLCPTGNRYAGLPGCDKYSNGPYEIEAQFLTAFRAQCSTCTAADKEILNKMILDSSSRLVAEQPLNTDAELSQTIIQSYELLISMCGKKCPRAELADYKAKIAEAQKTLAQGTSKIAAAAKPGDATPEGQYTTVDRNQTWATLFNLTKQLGISF